MNRKTFIGFLVTLVCLGAAAQTRWQNPLEAGENTIHGRWWNSELRDTYHRLPPRAEGVVRGAVWNLSKQAAGLSVCFHTNSPSIKVRYTVAGGSSFSYVARGLPAHLELHRHIAVEEVLAAYRPALPLAAVHAEALHVAALAAGSGSQDAQGAVGVAQF